ncbi:MAG: urea ABC transporter ATP-binding protein UrtD [Candidatus Epulonipiscioides saccharophilum]|nr:MAG: urea ABC transporter ATP-binding protein UrtD [Epulopiscium sp. AS2M-Bin001]
MLETVIDIRKISVNFDGFQALTSVSAKVQRNSIHFFIGPNGAGKTTLLDIICAKTKPTSGRVSFFSQKHNAISLTGMKEYQIVRKGIGRKFQVPSIFENLTVGENMELSLKSHKGIWSSIFQKPDPQELEEINRVLNKINLSDKINVRAGTLAHGQKQWLEIGMQLVQKPEVIMLDEPAAGMGKSETFKTGEILRELKSECTIIVIEHDMEFVKQIADVVTVLHEGKVLCHGHIDDILNDPTVQAVYLGRGKGNE